MSQISNLVTAYDTFVKGCKADGIWDSIKACCIMSGWDGLNGALTPLKGTAPTNFNFITDDYDRKTGLIGDGATKYLDSNRNNNADPQNSKSVSAYVTSTSVTPSNIIGAGGGDPGATIIGGVTGSTRLNCATVASGVSGLIGFIGASRASSTEYIRRRDSINSSIAQASQTPYNGNLFIFNNNGVVSSFAVNRLSFYHIGESLDLAALDSRVSTLMTTINSVIP